MKEKRKQDFQNGSPAFVNKACHFADYYQLPVLKRSRQERSAEPRKVNSSNTSTSHILSPPAILREPPSDATNTFYGNLIITSAFRFSLSKE